MTNLDNIAATIWRRRCQNNTYMHIIAYTCKSKRMRTGWFFCILCSFLAISSCKKTEEVSVGGNNPPNYNSIPTIKIENYVNRLFIDLTGREATDTERIHRTDYLKKYKLSFASRDTLIRQLMEDTVYHVGDSSYRHAYYQRIYDLSKARFLEGATDDEIGGSIGILEFGITIARLEGDSITVYSNKASQENYRKILKSKWLFRHRLISYAEMCASMLNNSIYDDINMGSFNFVNATFNDILSRFPSKDEFTRSYDIIDKNNARVFFGQWASNKSEYCEALTKSTEFYEAQIRWMYYVLMQRPATTQEVINLYTNYAATKNLEKVQLAILRSDEYAQFIR